MNEPKGKRLERLVAALHHTESQGAVVTWDDVIDGRQFDVTIRFKFGLHNYLTVIECKDYSSKVNVEKVDAFVTKSRSANSNKAIMVSSHGFQSRCHEVAKTHGIDLLVLSEICTTTTEELISRITPGLNVYGVTFKSKDGERWIEFEDWGGRHAYLCKRSILNSPSSSTSPKKMIDDWLLTQPEIDLNNENQVVLPLPDGTSLIEPDGEPAKVTSMAFKCKIVDVAVPNRPMPDTHIFNAMNTHVELRDVAGKVRHKAKLRDLPMGFDGKVSPGKFYENSNLCQRYLCESVDGDIVKWLLLESYQFGMLVQARISQKIAFAKYYVEVTDPGIVQRLEVLLAKFRVKEIDKANQTPDPGGPRVVGRSDMGGMSSVVVRVSKEYFEK